MAFAPRTLIRCTEPSDRGGKLVAVIGAIGDFAVYEGKVLWDDHLVASEGDKISEEEARRKFPELASYHYRP